mmetsp:Transcript_4951/g.15010  ORF Transcript_4951/g.15010 Transcript_4951/m.15010 type:complete len:314 (-) Transcript_4951:16-957(-)
MPPGLLHGGLVPLPSGVRILDVPRANLLCARPPAQPVELLPPPVVEGGPEPGGLPVRGPLPASVAGVGLGARGGRPVSSLGRGGLSHRPGVGRHRDPGHREERHGTRRRGAGGELEPRGVREAPQPGKLGQPGKVGSHLRLMARRERGQAVHVRDGLLRPACHLTKVQINSFSFVLPTLSLSRLHVNKTQPDRTPPVTGTHRSNARRPDEGRTGEERKKNDRRPLQENSFRSRFALGEACEARLPRLCCVCGCWMPMPEAATRGPGAARLWRARERVLPRGGPRGLSLTSRLGRASARLDLCLPREEHGRPPP